VTRPDEIKEFVDTRYISPCEASQRLFGFKMHQQFPNTVRLPVHLHLEQTIFFSDQDKAADVLARNANSHLLGYFNLNSSDPFARDLFYYQIPKYYTWEQKKKNLENAQNVNTNLKIFKN
jgi:hypothetical protein